MPFDPNTATPTEEPKSKLRFDPGTAMPDSLLSSAPFGTVGSAGTNRRDDDAQAVRVRSQERGKREKFISENAQPGRALNLDTGIPASTRARLSFENDLGMQADILRKQGYEVRPTKDGSNLIISKAGDKEEVLLHPMNKIISGGDVASAAFPLAKAATSVGVAALTGGASVPIQAGAQALAMGGAEALGEGGSRLVEGQPLTGVGSDVIREAGLAGALPLAGAVIVKGAQGARNLLTRGGGALEKELPEAAARLGVPTTAAETSGSPLLAKLGKLTPEEEAARQGALQASQNRAIGPSGRGGVLSEAEIADEAKPIFAAAEQAESGAVRRGLTEAEKAANAQIQASLDSGLVPTKLTNSEAGGFIRGKFDDFLAKVEADAAKNYPAFHAKAAEEGITLNKKPISDLVKQLEKEDPTGAAELLAPSIKQVRSVEGALTKPLASAAPERRIGFTVEPGAPAVPAPDLSFQDAIKLRSIVRTKLNSPTDPLGDVVKSYYSRLEKALTETIDDGLQRGSPELRSLYETARGSYAKGADALDRGVVQKLFRNVGEAGRVPDEDVIRQVFTGSGKLTALRDMKNILDPQDYKLLLRAGLNNLVDDAKVGGELVDASKFLSRLNALDNEVRAEVLGPQLEKSLRSNATLMQRAQGAKVPLDELEDALAMGSDAGKLLEQAIAREQNFQRGFNSTVQRKLRDGVLDPKTANDDHFVTWLMGDGVAAADARQAFGQIAGKSPQLAEKVRQRVLTNVLDEAGIKPPTGKLPGEVFDSNPEVLDKLLKGPSREKLQAALGAEGIQFLDDLAVYARATGKRLMNEGGRQASAETLAKEGLSGAAGFTRNAIGAAVELTGLAARKLGGGALVRKPAIQRWIETGELPKLSNSNRIAVLSAPEVLQANEAVGPIDNRDK